MSDHHSHRLRPMTARDPNEPHRVATPLELLLDLTFVVAFAAASEHLAEALSTDHLGAGMVAFSFVLFGITWAWIQFTWFASSYDVDDWLYRLLTAVVMVGVVVLTLGIPDVFASIEHGEHLDNRVVVLGYVVMRVPMAIHWLRASRAAGERARQIRRFVAVQLFAQALWVVLSLVSVGVGTAFALFSIPFVIELLAPILVERVGSGGVLNSWHPHHIAERYSLLVIIALGEGILGVTLTLRALVGDGGPGWTFEVAVLGLAGVALIVGMWWIYFAVPFGSLLARHRGRSFEFGYGQIPLIGSIVAVGAGLHVAANRLSGHSALTSVSTTLAVGLPVAIYVALVFAIYSALTRTFDAFHVLLAALTGCCLAVAIALAAAGVSMVWCVAVLSLTPWITVLGYELVGHRRIAEVVAGDSE